MKLSNNHCMELMDSNSKATVPSQAHPETMDFLSTAWCNFAVQALQPPHDHSLVLAFDHDMTNVPTFPKVDKSMKMDDAEAKSIPPWKANDVKSWIWMQQAMHPELNYNSCFRKKWLPWKMMPLKTVSIKKWFKELKLKRKEDERLQRAQVHAAISVAGVAAALAAVAAEKKPADSSRDAAVASAAALVAAQCAQMAQSLGARRKDLHSAIGSAVSATDTTDILTLTAAASTSLKGAATLKARKGYKNKLSGGAPVLPIEDTTGVDFNFEKCRSALAIGAKLRIETPDGKYQYRVVSVILNREAKVILKTTSLNLLKNKKKCVVMELHAELYKDPEGDKEGGADSDTCYMIVLTTNCGTMKLDMEDDYQLYKTWANTITHMLMHSTSLAKYQLQFYNN